MSFRVDGGRRVLTLDSVSAVSRRVDASNATVPHRRVRRDAVKLTKGRGARTFSRLSGNAQPTSARLTSRPPMTSAPISKNAGYSWRTWVR